MWVPPKSSPTILFDVRSVKQVIAAASVNLRWHSAQTNSLCYKELLTILFDVRSVKQVIAAASVNLRWHSAQTNSLCYKELLTFPKIRPSLILRFDMSEMDDCHTHEIQEKRDGIVFGFD